MKLLVVFALLGLFLAAASADRSLFKRTSVPKGWNMVGPADRDELMHFHVALPQRNVAQLVQTWQERTSPASPTYRQWLSAEEVVAMVAPEAAVSQRVAAWLRSHGVDELVERGDVIEVTAPVQVVERLFSTKVMQFERVAGSEGAARRIIAAYPEHSVPESIADDIEAVFGVARFSNLKAPHRFRRPAAGSPAATVPFNIKQQYDISQTLTTLDKKTTQAVMEFEPGSVGSFSAKDLAAFVTGNALPTPEVHIVGPYVPREPQPDESNLDIQYISGVSEKANNTFWTMPGNDWVYEMAQTLLTINEPPFVISISWGGNEKEQDASGMSWQQYIERTDVELAKVGLLGVSIMVATGDNGAAGDNGCSTGANSFQADYPATSPFVTAVGATMFQTIKPQTNSSLPPVCTSNGPCAAPGPEVTCSYPTALITSGGGFSALVNRSAATYQEAVVQQYLKTAASSLPPSNTFNSANRAYPDVSAAGHNYLIHDGGAWVKVDGTSCSTPVFSAMVSLLNDYLLQNNKPVLGPLNPLLYQMAAQQPSTFTDITVGSNKCTSINFSRCCTNGYPAAVGWDATTGLGTPVFSEILAYIKTNNL